MHQIIQDVIEFIDSHLEEKITVDVLGRAAGLSASRISGLFKDEVGIAPIRYVRQRRMEKARRLLDTTALSIKEIRMMVGYSDRSQFSRGFKEVFGVGPLEYRRRRRRVQS